MCSRIAPLATPAVVSRDKKQFTINFVMQDCDIYIYMYIYPLQAARVLFRLKRKLQRKGHICPTWLRLPISFCISSKVTFCLHSMFAISFKIFLVFSVGNFQERFSVLKINPSTLPCVEFEKALSNFLQLGARAMPMLLQTVL